MEAGGSMLRKNKKGFTLIELMIVVAIIGILAAIAIPKFADLIKKSKEGATKGGLSSMRSAIQVYYGDNEGWFPTDTLSVLTTDGKYINSIPEAKLPDTGHADSNSVVAFTSFTSAGAFDPSTNADNGGWAYFNNSSASSYWGEFKVNCTHNDVKDANVWTSF